MPNRPLIALLLAASALAGPVGCAGVAPPAASSQAAQLSSGIDLAGMDRTVDPGDDFYAYANGNWMRTTEIPADRAATGAFLQAALLAERRNAELIESIVSSNPAPGTDEARIANFYRSFMDRPGIDAAGLGPIRPDLERIAAIGDRRALSRALGASLRADVDPLNASDFRTENLFGIFVTQGLATPGVVLPYMLQGGLGLPEREYYLSDSPRMAEIRTAYRAYIETQLRNAGLSDPAARADRIFALETKIARGHATRAESEDFTRTASVWRRDEFASRAPGIDWPAFFEAARLGGQDRFGAYHADAIRNLSALVASEPLEAWKDWMAFHQINTNAAVLPSAIDDAFFAFYGTTLSGTPQQRSRDRRALVAVNPQLGDAVGRLYVQRYFPASAKAQVSEMVGNITAAFRRRVEGLDWMAPETRAEALRKIETLRVGVGYPESWRDYARFTVSPDEAYGNKLRGEEAEYLHQIAKLGRPFDREEWWMTPQTVNAINLPVQNGLNFPAAILEPPFFDPGADPARNYGAIGAVIGHEISHSFDNNGAAFDSTGVLRNWWTPADLARFEREGRALAAQYDAYAPYPDAHLNGTLTLGENIADVAGLAAAYEAYRASLGGREAPVIDGFTGDQRFFIAYAQTWRSKAREAALRQQIATDGHAPGQYRALTVRNLDAWYRAFDVQPGDALYLPPEQRVRVW
ncbi:MAG: putative endopeptidase [Sphingomonadales bacterium]|jgi:predicted metalloendopeptidase|nr:putative endopeptidase [Sphingomonadales bacterium]